MEEGELVRSDQLQRVSQRRGGGGDVPGGSEMTDFAVDTWARCKLPFLR